MAPDILSRFELVRYGIGKAVKEEVQTAREDTVGVKLVGIADQVLTDEKTLARLEMEHVLLSFDGRTSFLLVALDYELIGDVLVDAVALVFGEIPVGGEEENLNVEARK